MVLPIPRIHFYEIADQSWFPSFLRARIQASLTLLWTTRLPILQSQSPASLAISILKSQLGDRISDFAYVDFCAGAGGPTPFFERELNAELAREEEQLKRKERNGIDRRVYTNGVTTNEQIAGWRRPKGPVDFILTDIHPHIDAWEAACKKSDHLHYVATPIDAANAPPNILQLAGLSSSSSSSSLQSRKPKTHRQYQQNQQTVPPTPKQQKPIFRIFSLAFHHLPTPLARSVLHNTLSSSHPPSSSSSTAGFLILELQSRTLLSIIQVLLLFPLMFLGSWYWFWDDPIHLFFTYVIPILPTVLVFDGLVSCLRTRTEGEVWGLMGGRDFEGLGRGWVMGGGERVHTFGVGKLGYFGGVRRVEGEE